MKIRTNWELDIESAECPKIYARGEFYLTSSGELILGYNQEDEYNFHKNAKLVSVKDGNIREIFETKERLWAPVLDENENTYLATYDIDHRQINEGTLSKIGNENKLLWQYPLKGRAESLPVVGWDSVVIFDFIGGARSGRVSRISIDGKLISEKSFKDFICYEPLIMKNNPRIISCFRGSRKLYLMDFDGNILVEKDDDGAGITQTDNGDIYACLHRGIVSLDENLNYLWEYMPPGGCSVNAPVVDKKGNIFNMLSGNSLLCLDPRGKERWISRTTEYIGYQPCILNDGNILMLTSGRTWNRKGKEQSRTYFEIFSSQGENIFKYELPGFVFHSIVADDNTVYIVNNCCHDIIGKEFRKKTVKIFSITVF
jgi:hypothetical protein